MDGLLHTTLKPSTFPVEDTDVVCLERMVLGLQMGAHWGGFSFVFCHAFSKISFCLSHIVLITVAAVDLVNDAGFVQFVSFVFRGNKLTADGIHRFCMNRDASFPDLPADCFCHTLYVRDSNMPFTRGGVTLGGGGWVGLLTGWGVPRPLLVS